MSINSIVNSDQIVSPQEGEKMSRNDVLSVFENLLFGNSRFVKGRQITDEEFKKLWREDRQKLLIPKILTGPGIGGNTRKQVEEERKKEIEGIPSIFTPEFASELNLGETEVNTVLGEMDGAGVVSGFTIKFLDTERKNPVEVRIERLKIDSFFKDMLEIKEVGLGFAKFGFK